MEKHALSGLVGVLACIMEVRSLCGDTCTFP